MGGTTRVGVSEFADRVVDADERSVERRAGGAGFEVGFDGAGGVGVEGAVEVVRDVLAGVPAAHGYSFESVAPFGAGGEGGHECHPSSPESLLGGRETDPFEVGDLLHGPFLDVVEQNSAAIDERKTGKGILEFMPGGGAVDDSRRVDGVLVVVPLRVHVGDYHLSVGPPRAVGGEVAQDPFQPCAEWCVVAVLVGTFDGADEGVLGEVGGEVLVTDQRAGEPVQRGDLGDEIVGCHRHHLQIVTAAQTVNTAPTETPSPRACSSRHDRVLGGTVAGGEVCDGIQRAPADQAGEERDEPEDFEHRAERAGDDLAPAQRQQRDAGDDSDDSICGSFVHGILLLSHRYRQW